MNFLQLHHYFKNINTIIELYNIWKAFEILIIINKNNNGNLETLNIKIENYGFSEVAFE